MSKEGYYRWCGSDGGYWLNEHTYYYDGSRMKTEGGDTLQSLVKTVGYGGSWEYVGETLVPRKEPIVYICELCGRGNPCHLVIIEEPLNPPNGCPFHLPGVDWHRRTDG